MKKIFFVTFLSLFIFIILFFQVKAIGDFRIDDAYITFSFSKNLALGKGPIYGWDMRVEGYSNFLWMALLAVPFAIFKNTDLYLLSRLLILPFAGLLLWSFYQLSREFLRPAFAVLATFSLVLFTDLTTAGLSGLETIPYTAFLSFGFYRYLKDPENFWVIPAFVLAALTRIDGFGPLLFILAFEFLRRLLEARFSITSYLKWMSPVLIYGIWFLWRWHYYGLPLPTTYYAKSLIPILLPHRGLDYVIAAFHSWGFVVVLPFILFSVIREFSWKVGVIALFSIAHILYVIKVGGDWMPYERFLIPILPLIVILFVSGIEQAWESVSELGFGQKMLTMLVCFGAMVFVSVYASRFSVDTPEEQGKIDFVRAQDDHVQNSLLPAAHLMNYVIRPGEKLVTDYAGVFPVYTQAHVIDMWGLCNARVAREGGVEGVNPIYGKSCAKCYADEQPDYFHVWVPLLKPLNAFRNQDEVIQNIFLSGLIQRYLNLRDNYVTGRVIDEKKQKAFFFLERRKPTSSFQPRQPAPGILIDYPFIH